MYDGYPAHILDLQLRERNKILALGKEVARRESVLSALQNKLTEVRKCCVVFGWVVFAVTLCCFYCVQCTPLLTVFKTGSYLLSFSQPSLPSSLPTHFLQVESDHAAWMNKHKSASDAELRHHTDMMVRTVQCVLDLVYLIALLCGYSVVQHLLYPLCPILFQGYSKRTNWHTSANCTTPMHSLTTFSPLTFTAPLSDPGAGAPVGAAAHRGGDLQAAAEHAQQPRDRRQGRDGPHGQGQLLLVLCAIVIVLCFLL